METTAVMPRHNPFFERAGMTKIAESKPNVKVIEAVEKLVKMIRILTFLTQTKVYLFWKNVEEADNPV